MLVVKKHIFVGIRMSSTITSLDTVLDNTEELDNSQIESSFGGLGELLGGQRDIHGVYANFRQLAEDGGDNFIPRFGARSGALDLEPINVVRDYPPSLRENILTTLYGESNHLVLPNIPSESLDIISQAISHEGLQASLFNLVLAPGLVNNNLLGILYSLLSSPTVDQFSLIPNVVMFAVVPLHATASYGELYNTVAFLESINSLLRITTVATNLADFHSFTSGAQIALSNQFDASFAQLNANAANYLNGSQDIVSTSSPRLRLLVASAIGVPWIIYAFRSHPAALINESNVVIFSNNIDLVGSLFEKFFNFFKK